MKQIDIKELDQEQLQSVNSCDGIFVVEAKLVPASENSLIHYRIEPTIPYQKRYPDEKVDYRSYINNPDQIVFLAFLDNQIAGEIRLKQHWNRFGYIEDLVVDKNFRRCGIGYALIQRAIKWAKDHQLAGLMAETQDNNLPACLCYQRSGFELAGFDRMLYQGLNLANQEIALFWYFRFNG